MYGTELVHAQYIHSFCGSVLQIKLQGRRAGLLHRLASCIHPYLPSHLSLRALESATKASYHVLTHTCPHASRYVLLSQPRKKAHAVLCAGAAQIQGMVVDPLCRAKRNRSSNACDRTSLPSWTSYLRQAYIMSEWAKPFFFLI